MSKMRDRNIQKKSRWKEVNNGSYRTLYNENFYLMHTNDVTYADRVNQEG